MQIRGNRSLSWYSRPVCEVAWSAAEFVTVTGLATGLYREVWP